MCAILDANVAHEVFGNPNDAGKAFLDWITEGSHRLVIGGKNRKELGERQGFIGELIRRGNIRRFEDTEVDAITQQLREDRSCRSDDEHIIALAKISGARLLYSNDQLLQRDFNEKELIDKPRGKVYSTHKTDEYDNSKFDEAKRRLLNRNLCQQT